MPRVLFIVPSATYRAADFLEAARTLGVEVTVAFDEEPALGELMGARALRLALSDPEAAADAIVAHDSVAPLDAVVAVDDQGVLAAAIASERLGLRHNPPKAVSATRDKLAMRHLLERAEISQPSFSAIPAGSGDEQIAKTVESVGLPCVLKPTSLSASQGVLRADSIEDAVEVAKRVRRIATDAGVPSSNPLMVERFVPGSEVAVEGLLIDGGLEILAVFDKPDPLDGPAFEETIYLTPSKLSEADSRSVVDATAKASQALGLREGPVHAELRVDEGRASIIEVAARTIGGLCSRALAFSTGRTLEQLVVAHAVGISLGPITREDRASGVLMIPIPRAGTLGSIVGIDKARSIPFVEEVQITIPLGRHVQPVPEGNRYLGFVFARARRLADVESALRNSKALIEVDIS